VKLIIKLAIVALIANAGYHVGTEYLAHIRFRDAVREVATFRSTDNADLRRRVAEQATKFDIPQADEELDITRQARHVVVKGQYQKQIEIVPSYFYPWDFKWELDVQMPAQLPYYPPGK